MAQEKPHSAELQDSQDYRSQNYRIHIGDVLQVSVYKHPELSRKIVLQGDANYILPAEDMKTQEGSAIDDRLREMQMAGLTALNVATALREKLKPMIADPQVTITVVDTVMRPLTPSDKPSPQLRDTPPPVQKQGVVSAQEKPLPKVPSDTDYRICTGDVLQISIYQHPELSKVVVVTQEGNITLPSGNAMKAVGLSLVALVSLLRDQLKSVVPDAQVTVMVKIHHGPPVPLRREPWPRDITPPNHRGCCDS